MLIASTVDAESVFGRSAFTLEPAEPTLTPSPVAAPPSGLPRAPGGNGDGAGSCEEVPRRTLIWSGIVHVKDPSPLPGCTGGAPPSSLAAAAASKGSGGSPFSISS